MASEDLITRAEKEGKHLLFEGEEDALVGCDPDWTAEALGNLIKNGLDHTKEGGTVRVSWAASPAMIRICVEDDGSGIPPEEIHHIFKRFYRSSSSLDTQGIGLGLPLAKSIVEGQGGVLSVQSHPGEGNRIYHGFSVHRNRFRAGRVKGDRTVRKRGCLFHLAVRTELYTVPCKGGRENGNLKS